MDKEVKDTLENNRDYSFLPEDILEMCLVRLPLISLMNARLVCKRWRHLTSTPQFMQMRKDGFYQSQFLFIFGLVKNGCCSAEIQALDLSINQWHKLDSGFTKGRFSFSLCGIRDDIYVVGGNSSLTNFGSVDKSSFTTHKSVCVFSPLTKSWRKAASMKYARSSPILGLYEVSSDCVPILSILEICVFVFQDLYEFDEDSDEEEDNIMDRVVSCAPSIVNVNFEWWEVCAESGAHGSEAWDYGQH
ncbi:hypothetical protein QQ045_004353 [Rhodiola kirilowii]